MKRLAILGSTRGTDMMAIIDAIMQKKLNAKIEIVISNNEKAMILERARVAGLNAQFVDPKNINREMYDKKITMLLKEYSVNLIVLIGYMRILSKEFIDTWRNHIINIHPSLLPAFAGGMDQNVHQAVLNAGIKETGCTVHYVTEEIDAGPILIQKKCFVEPDDTIETLRARVQKLEGEALVEAINILDVS